MDPGLTWSQQFLLTWALAVSTALVARFVWRQPWLAAAGIGIVSRLAWDVMVYNLPLAIRDATIGAAPPARSEEALWSNVAGFVGALEVLALGFILYAVGRRVRREPAGRALFEELERIVPGGRRTIWASAASGAAAFPLLALANVLLYQGSNGLQNGDESAFNSNMTPLLAVVLPMLAALYEELFYRGFLMGGVARALRPAMPRPVATTVAVLLQATIFAIAHGGYGNLQHLVFAAAFAFLAAGVALWLGIAAAIALHFLIDFFVLGLDATPAQLLSLQTQGHYPWWLYVLWAAFVLNVAFAIAWGVRAIWRYQTRTATATK